MRIVIAGGSGFLGRPLIKTLQASGHEVTQLVRRPAIKPEQLTWNPAGPVRLPDDTAVVVNLCGAGIGHRWTAGYRQEIRDSRVIPTVTLAAAVAEQRIPLLVNASGVGSYGDTGDRETTEDSPALQGRDFLSRVSAEWEPAARAASRHGARVVLLRTGLPLKRDGGFLQPQILPFKLGVGGKLGNGKQWVPWLSFIDWIRAVQFIIGESDIDGPVNLTAPHPVTNAEFTKALGHALHRPTVMPIPKLGLRILFGEYSMEGYRSFRVIPQVLQNRGFRFEHPTVDVALRAALTS